VLHLGVSGGRHFQADYDQQFVTWKVCLWRSDSMDSCPAGRQTL